jgi:hypothetical protein
LKIFTGHTFGSRLVMVGVDLYKVKDLMGHESIEMVRPYCTRIPTEGSGRFGETICPTDTKIDTSQYYARLTHCGPVAQKDRAAVS